MSNDLVVSTGEQIAIIPKTIQELGVMSEGFFKSGFYPNVKSVQGAMVVIQTGLELGLTPAKAMNQINIINGRPALSAQCMNGLMQARGIKISTIKNDNTECIISGTRNGVTEEVSYKMEDAKKAGLDGKDNWKKYPRRMLFARAISELANKIAPDVIMGLYTQEEVEDFDAPNIGPDKAKDVTPRDNEIVTPQDNEIAYEIPTEKGWLDKVEEPSLMQSFCDAILSMKLGIQAKLSEMLGEDHKFTAHQHYFNAVRQYFLDPNTCKGKVIDKPVSAMMVRALSSEKGRVAFIDEFCAWRYARKMYERENKTEEPPVTQQGE